MSDDTTGEGRLHRLTVAGYTGATHELNTAIEEPNVNWTAHKPIQSEGTAKVLAYRALPGGLRALRAAGYQIAKEGTK